MNLTNTLIQLVDSHPVLNNEWLLLRRESMSLDDLTTWLTQEYHVSVAFVKWFLWTAALTDDIQAKIVLVQNIWEELGEGRAEDSHVKILEKFLIDLGIHTSRIELFSETGNYLSAMEKITRNDFYEAMGALGPANEYLLKREYSQMHAAYSRLKETIQLPDATFFKINLEADESHSAKMFRLIEFVCDTNEKREKVIAGTVKALDARMLFYRGLVERDQSMIVN